ncbi:MAG: hypothetical protein AAFY19_00045 [Pseudomonadota bacterium]
MAKNSQPFSEDEIDALETYVQYRELIELGLATGARFSKSGYPGYLSVLVEGKNWYVPCHLASVFPPGDVCSQLADLVGLVALDFDNAVCLSGSATFLGELGAVGDIDFCEYGEAEGAALAKRAARKTRVIKEAVLVECKCEDDAYSAPWDNFESHLNAALSSHSEAGHGKSFKLDFVTNTTIGLMPTTVMVLTIVNAQFETGNALRSHPLQEAVISGINPPRLLTEIENFGRYASFLIDEADDLLHGRTNKSEAASIIKALKRILSYVLLLGDTQLKDEVIEGLGKDVIESIVIEGRKAELGEMVRKIEQTDHPIVNETAKQVRDLAAQSSPIDFTKREVIEALASVKQIAVSLLDELQLDIQHYAGSA